MTRGSIFAKLSGLSGTAGYLRKPNWNSVVGNKEQAGLIVRGVVVKGIIGYFGYELGTRMFSKATKKRRYELLLQEAKEALKLQERFLKGLDEAEDKLLQQYEKLMKKRK